MKSRKTTTAVAALAEAKQLPAAERKALESLTTPVNIAAGEVLMTQGAFGNEAFLLLEGELLVERDGNPLAVLTAGAIVGEQAVLLNEPRNATVTTATAVTIAAMNRREFSTMLEQCPTLARDVLNTAIERASAALS